MTLTPWGDSVDLRHRRLPPGPSGDPEAVERHQRERLFGAMVAVASERGYGPTRVEDVLELSGVSRSTFYQYFDSKLDCFLATLDEIVAAATGAMTRRLVHDEPWDVRLRNAFAALVDLVVAQPAAARLCFVEAYAAGPQAVERIERPARAFGRAVMTVLEQSPERAGMPRDVVRAVLGGLRTVIHLRLHSHREAELPLLVPPLMDWALGYRSPPEPLQEQDDPLPAPEAPPRDGSDARDRILAAVTELVARQGYARTTVTDVATHASISLTTFYDRFEGKESAFLAALDDVMLRELEITIPPYRDANDWPHAVRAGIYTLLAHLSSEPATARFGGAAVWAAGAPALERLGDRLTGFEVLLGEGLGSRPTAPPVAAEAIGSSVLALIYDHIRRASAERLYEIAPPAAFVALAPAIGSIEACAVVNERVGAQ